MRTVCTCRFSTPQMLCSGCVILAVLAAALAAALVGLLLLLLELLLQRPLLQVRLPCMRLLHGRNFGCRSLMYRCSERSPARNLRLKATMHISESQRGHLLLGQLQRLTVGRQLLACSRFIGLRLLNVRALLLIDGHTLHVLPVHLSRSGHSCPSILCQSPLATMPNRTVASRMSSRAAAARPCSELLKLQMMTQPPALNMCTWGTSIRRATMQNANIDTCIETHHEAHLLQQRPQVPLQDPEVALAGHVPAVDLLTGQRLDLVRRQFAVLLRPAAYMHARDVSLHTCVCRQPGHSSAVAATSAGAAVASMPFMAACAPVLCAGLRIEARRAASNAQLPVNFVQATADVGTELAAVTCQQLHLYKGRCVSCSARKHEFAPHQNLRIAHH
jgi:hypothetical protein